jgi:hypothetical protein
MKIVITSIKVVIRTEVVITCNNSITNVTKVVCTQRSVLGTVLEPIKMALSSSEPTKLTEIAPSCGLAILVVFIPYVCLLAIKGDM